MLQDLSLRLVHRADIIPFKLYHQPHNMFTCPCTEWNKTFSEWICGRFVQLAAHHLYHCIELCVSALAYIHCRGLGLSTGYLMCECLCGWIWVYLDLLGCKFEIFYAFDPTCLPVHLHHIPFGKMLFRLFHIRKHREPNPPPSFLGIHEHRCAHRQIDKFSGIHLLFVFGIHAIVFIWCTFISNAFLHCLSAHSIMLNICGVFAIQTLSVDFVR